MTFTSKSAAKIAVIGLLAGTASIGAVAQEYTNAEGEEVLTTVVGSPPADLEGLAEGPEVEGIVSARNGNDFQVTTADGQNMMISLSEGTTIRASGGFLGLGRDQLGADQLLNGLPVKVDTVEWAGSLVASKIALKNKDLRTANMIRNGTNQRFGQNEADIAANAALAEALKGRVADIDKYNIRGTTNVYFDTGRYNLSGQAQAELCQAAAEAEAMENALLLVVGYTDSTGSYEVNQTLSEKRAGRVVNFLQQECKWKPWRMLSPTGMAASDPAADNTSAYGKAQNRRVAVNILVSKSVEGL